MAQLPEDILTNQDLEDYRNYLRVQIRYSIREIELHLATVAEMKTKLADTYTNQILDKTTNIH